MKKYLMLLCVAILTLSSVNAYPHCQIPCGIYDDAMRIELLLEHAGTIKKSMLKIKELSRNQDKNYNQLVRWITNKELHADKIQRITAQYFMTQRITPAPQDNKGAHTKYIREITLLHEILIGAMKAKQGVDTDTVTLLEDKIKAFKLSYLGAPEKNLENSGDRDIIHYHETTR